MIIYSDSLDIFSFFFQLTSPKELEISLKSKELEPPHLRIMYNPDESLHGIYIVGDGDYIDAGDIVLDALVTTIAVYYVFDLDYPDIFSQILGILQQYVVKDVYTGRKGSKYVRFSKWISGKMSE